MQPAATNKAWLYVVSDYNTGTRKGKHKYNRGVGSMRKHCKSGVGRMHNKIERRCI